MKKKLLTTMLVLGCAFAMAACGTKKQSSAPASSGPAPKEEQTAVCVAGEFLVGEAKAEWGYTQGSVMTASTVEAVTALDAGIGAKLAAADLKDVYTIENVYMGTAKEGWAGWTTKILVDGVVKEVDGTYALKACLHTYDEEDSKWLNTQYYPDPHTECAQNLSPATLFIPTWQEADDPNGFKWNMNPGVIAGAGKYTVVFARYNTAADETKTDQWTCGLGVIKVQDMPEYEPPVILDHTFGVIGSFNGWGADVEMTKVDDTHWTLDYEFAANDEFKIRADGAWTDSFGYDKVTSGATLAESAGGNIKVLAAGTLRIGLEVTFGEGSVIEDAAISLSALV